MAHEVDVASPGDDDGPPFVRLKTTNLQQALVWLHEAFCKLASDVEAKHEQSQEQHSELQAQIAALQAGAAGSRGGQDPAAAPADVADNSELSSALAEAQRVYDEAEKRTDALEERLEAMAQKLEELLRGGGEGGSAQAPSPVHEATVDLEAQQTKQLEALVQESAGHAVQEQLKLITPTVEEALKNASGAMTLAQQLSAQLQESQERLRAELQQALKEVRGAVPDTAKQDQLTGQLQKGLEEVRSFIGDIAKQVRGLAEAQKSLSKVAPAPDVDELFAHLDQRTESRLETVWQELRSHSEAAAERARETEARLRVRVEQAEHGSARALDAITTKLQSHGGNCGACCSCCPKAEPGHLRKQLEWLNWRITWLEWATGGQKRSFGRPLAAGALAALPPPVTPAATSFCQPLAEDFEMWAREPAGHVRPRRRNTSSPPEPPPLSTSASSPIIGAAGQRVLAGRPPLPAVTR